jgi:hypothetical protein
MPAQRNTTRLLWLDKEDQALFDGLPDLAWCDNKTEAFAHALRYCLMEVFHNRKSHHAFFRATEDYTRHQQNLLRLSRREWDALHAFQRRISAESLSEAGRVVVRMGHAYFTKLEQELNDLLKRR